MVENFEQLIRVLEFSIACMYVSKVLYYAHHCIFTCHVCIVLNKADLSSNN